MQAPRNRRRSRRPLHFGCLTYARWKADLPDRLQMCTLYLFYFWPEGLYWSAYAIAREYPWQHEATLPVGGGSFSMYLAIAFASEVVTSTCRESSHVLICARGDRAHLPYTYSYTSKADLLHISQDYARAQEDSLHQGLSLPLLCGGHGGADLERCAYK